MSDATRATDADLHCAHGSVNAREDLPPANCLDLIDRHLSRAVESDESAERYQRVLKGTTLWVGTSVLVCMLGLGFGVAVACLLLSSLTMAVGIGAGATTLGTAMFLLGRRRMITARRRALSGNGVPAAP